MTVATPFGMLSELDCKREHLRLSFWLFFLAISVMFLIRHLLFMWILVLFCTINAYIALGIYWGTRRTIWWSHKAHIICIILLGALWITLPIYLAYYESIIDFCMARPGYCGVYHFGHGHRKWLVYLYAALYFVGIGMMVFAELCRLRMTAYLLAKACRHEERAAHGHVTITVGSELENEKDPREIIIVA
ncbi:unnamed protein product [Caenorhabditis sp. 36 PRJEB53466]|nr:unnamed protein product [Caenorhabditis sp. 36 PRJEB53466]